MIAKRGVATGAVVEGLDGIEDRGAGVTPAGQATRVFGPDNESISMDLMWFVDLRRMKTVGRLEPDIEIVGLRNAQGCDNLA